MIRPAELIPYARHEVTLEDEAAVLSALRSKWLTQGPKVEEFEAALALKAEASYCICVSSGTMALFLAYLTAKQYGFTRAMVPAITFVATATAAELAGLRVKLVDCDPALGHGDFADGYRRDVLPVPVTLGGRGIWTDHPRTIVDAAHGPIGPTSGWMTCLSFHPCKHVACGEGGAVLTNDEGAAQFLRQFRNHGRSPNGWLTGFNGRMPEMAAALGLSQLQRYDASVMRRQEIADYYRANLKNVLAPWYGNAGTNAWHLYQIHVTNRDRVAQRLLQEHVGTAVHYPVVPNQSPANLSGARQFAATTLSIPMFPSLTDAEVEYVAATVKRVVEECQ